MAANDNDPGARHSLTDTALMEQIAILIQEATWRGIEVSIRPTPPGDPAARIRAEMHIHDVPDPRIVPLTTRSSRVWRTPDGTYAVTVLEEREIALLLEIIELHGGPGLDGCWDYLNKRRIDIQHHP